MPDRRPLKRRRGAVACLRCKSRKHRCDNGYPSCGACLAASQECTYSEEDRPTGYVRSLEARLDAVEHHVLPSGARSADGHDSVYAESGPQSSTRHLRASVEPQREQRDIATAPPQDHVVSTGMSDLPPNSSYLGISSGFPLATMMQATISTREESGDTTVGSNTWLPTDGSLGWSHGWHGSGGNDITSSGVKATMPSTSVSKSLIAAYLNKVHTKHPFLSVQRIHKLGEQRQILRPAFKLSPDVPMSSRLDYCTLHLIYAIGARYLQLAEEYDYRLPADHYASALVDIKLAFAGRCLESLEVMTLLSIYQLRSPSEPGIWSIIGATMRQAVGCGLHRASNGSSLIDQRRKRIFWTIYMLERSVAVTLGRPFCVSDRDIDVDLPANITDDIDDEQRMLKAIEEASIESSKIHAISPALHIFRLHKIISKIQSTVHRVDRSISSANAIKIVQLRAALEDWKTGIQHSVSLIDENDAPNPYVTQSYHVLQYHKAMLFLLLPTLTWLPTSHPDFRVCAASAGLIGQLYRNLHNTQKVRISLSLLALHANLVAGLTLVYCFVADPTIFDAKFSGDIRACSTVLYIIAERWPAARKARDCLERFVQASVERCDETRNIDAGDSAMTFHFQREHQDAVCRTTTEHVSAQAAQLGIGDLPQSDDIWDIFGDVLNNGEGSWFGDVGAQDLLQFG